MRRTAVLAAAFVLAWLGGSAWALDTATPGMDSSWNLKEAITLAVAVLGAALGLLNTWAAISTRRVRVLVKTSFAHPFGGPDKRRMIGIEVVNLSAFAVTLIEVGFVLRGTDERIASSNPRVLDNRPLPRRIEPREAASTFVFFPPAGEPRIVAAYARLASGEAITGKGRAIKNLRAALAQAGGETDRD